MHLGIALHFTVPKILRDNESLFGHMVGRLRDYRGNGFQSLFHNIDFYHIWDRYPVASVIHPWLGSQPKVHA